MVKSLILIHGSGYDFCDSGYPLGVNAATVCTELFVVRSAGCYPYTPIAVLLARSIRSPRLPEAFSGVLSPRGELKLRRSIRRD